MSQLKKQRWRIVYGIGCLIYIVWMVNLSFNNFDMVHTDYRRAGERLQPARLEAIALRELEDDCRTKLRRSGVYEEVGGACRTFNEADIIAARQEVRGRLSAERSLFGRKLVLFYISFGLVFLILPLVIIYQLLSLILWLFQNLKIHK
ncbi:MAG: hypothetical protein OEL55_04765 [Desulfobulbaceae bacterium]|nr:hypothetical protein [Desulfobulbaceae bacterium]